MFFVSLCNSGSIDVEEMTKIVGSLYEMEGLAKVIQFSTYWNTLLQGSLLLLIWIEPVTVFLLQFYLKIDFTTVLQDVAMERTSTIFERLDINGDGELNEDEFVEGCLNNKKLANLLNTGASEKTEEVKQDSTD